MSKLITLKHILIVISVLSGILLVVLTLITATIEGRNGGQPFYEKADVQSKCIQAINNNADLETIKHIFVSKNPVYFTIFSSKLADFEIKYYRSDITLNQILMDIKVNYYIDHKDTANFLPSLNAIIRLNNDLNPFDRLEANQKYFFENIRAKSASQYSSISEDLYRISEELVQRNRLVNEYLADALWSYRLSVVALLLSVPSVILALLQYFKDRADRKKKSEA